MKAEVEKENRQLYMRYRKTDVDKTQADFEKKLMTEFKNKPKQLFNHVREKQKVKSGISQIRD